MKVALIQSEDTPYIANEADLKELADIYRELNEELPSSGLCRSCGDCCNFEKYDHELRVTHIELLYLIKKHGLRRPVKEGVCPYLENGLCSAREGRALGCRIFFCEGDKKRSELLYEIYLDKIRNLTSKSGNEMYFGELLNTLRDVM